MNSESAWTPSCNEDELLLAIVRLSRAIRSVGGGDASTVALLHDMAASGPSRARDIAENVNLDQSTVSRHLVGLQARGYVSKGIDPEDRRATLLTITEAGLSELQRQVAIRVDLVRSATQGWSEADRANLTLLMKRLADDVSTSPTDDRTTNGTTEKVAE